MSTTEFIVAMLLLLPVAACAEALFEDQLIVPVPESWHGPRGMPGDLIELTDGRLLLAYTRYGYAAGGKETGIWARTSDDRGQTWSEEYPLLLDPGPPSENGRYAHPSFLRLPDGDLLMSYIYDVSVDPGYGHTYYRRSDDDGETWSDQFILTPHPERMLVHNDKLVLLSDGRIIAPAEFSPGAQQGSHSNYVSTAYYSDNNGYAWRMSQSIIRANYEVQEPHVVELRDGRLMMMFRTYSGFCGRSYSEDRGQTWSEPEALEDVPMTPRASAITVDRIPSTGDLLLIRCRGLGQEERARTPLVSAISTDEGETWEHERVLFGEPDGDYGYQSVDFVDDMVILSYHQRDGLHVARIGVQWLYEE
ncbi:MAG: sialidase family protein [Armatimonadota bacterium]